MAATTLKVLKLHPAAILPKYAHRGDSGLDLYSVENFPLRPRQRRLVSTGLAIQLPLGAEGQIRPRSGLAATHGVTVLNAPGTIDAGYRGEIRVLLINLGQSTYTITVGMKIAQLIISPVLVATVREVRRLTISERGQRGFGSTGV